MTLGHRIDSYKRAENFEKKVGQNKHVPVAVLASEGEQGPALAPPPFSRRKHFS